MATRKKTAQAAAPTAAPIWNGTRPFLVVKSKAESHVVQCTPEKHAELVERFGAANVQEVA